MTDEDIEELGRQFKGGPDHWRDLEKIDPDRDYDFRNRILLSNPSNYNMTWTYRVRRHKDKKDVCIKMVTVRSKKDEWAYAMNEIRI